VVAGAALFSLGMAVFFIGLAIMRRGIAGFAGAGLRTRLASLTRRPLGAAATGLVLTLCLQSSSLITVVLMELVDADLVPYPAAVAVILGGNVGAALTVQFLAVRLYDLALPLMAAGAVAALTLPPPRLRAGGTALFGFGVLYGGIAVVSAAVAPLASHGELARLLAALARSPLGAGLFGLVLTATVQSNGIANGLILELGRRGLMPLATSAAVIAGANVGSGALALIAALSASRLARRLAVANALVNVAGLVWVVPCFPLFVRVVGASTRDSAQALANAHILFNLLASATLIPVTAAFARFSAAVADRVFAAAPAWERAPWPARRRPPVVP
jgi:phosphate:Na+ symporter